MMFRDSVSQYVGRVMCFRVIDVGSEWRTFSNDKATGDPSRVGAAEVVTNVHILLSFYANFVKICHVPSFCSDT